MIRYLISRLEKYGDKVVVEDGTSAAAKEITARQMTEDVGRICFFWKQYFKEPGHHVGIMAENSYHWLIQCIGIIASGNVAVLYNHNLSEEGLLDFILQSDTEVALCDDGMLSEYERCRAKIPFIELSSACHQERMPFADREDAEVIMMLFSSGTSGKSKIVQITNKNARICMEHLCAGEMDGRKTILMPVPLYHIVGIMFSYITLAEGNRIVISSAKYLMRSIKKGNITRAYLVPSMLQMFLRQVRKGEIKTEQIEKLNEIHSFGASLLPGMDRQLSDMGIRVSVFYGLTEACAMISGYGEYRAGAAGKPAPFVEIRLEDGEIVVQGDNIMKGYYGNQEETEKVCKNGWFYTGDLGKIDEDGYLYICGRKKNVIILPNGENVSPEEIEERLYRCPLITECRVFAGGHSIQAEIYSSGEHPDFTERKAEIERFVKEMNVNLPLTHRLREIYISETELGKTATGKIKRF